MRNMTYETTRYKIVIAIIAVLAGQANAEVVTDGSTGAAGQISGPNYDIAASLGTQAGTNLFHSFTTFNINTNETANFNGPVATGAVINNVIGRVTGGSFSNIDGTINNNILGSNLWLVNPAGMVFGSNASINVSGSFHVSSGDSILFDDSSSFAVGSMNDPWLIVANPAGFGFVSANPGSIVVNTSNIAVGSGQTVSLVGGDVNLNGSTLEALDGRLNLVAVNGAGDVTFSDPATPLDSGVSFSGSSNTLANISLSSSSLNTSGDAGAIYILGNQFVIDPQSTITNNNVDTNGGVIHIKANDVILNAGFVESSSSGLGDSGDIVIQANNLTVSNDGTTPPLKAATGLVVEATGSGIGGNINIDVTNNVTVDGGTLRTFAADATSGGDININATELQVINQGKIYTSTTGNNVTSGSINIAALNNVLVSGVDSSIEIQTDAQVDAGGIEININTGNLTVTDSARVSTDENTGGSAAGITIVADDMTVSNNGRVDSRTYDGPAGTGIDIDLSNNLLVTGDGAISTDTFNNGTGSQIDINAKNISISDGGNISASTKRDGQAGAITVTAVDTISIIGAVDKEAGFFSVSGDDPLIISPSPTGAPYIGVGGLVDLSADRLVIENGGLISAKAINEGNAGNININLTDELLMDNSSIVTSALLSAGGEVNVQVTNLVSLTNSDITAEAFGVVPATSSTASIDGGNITIDPVNVVLNNSDLVARANAGNGGNITVVADAFLRSADSVLDATSRTGIDGEVLVETLNQQVNVIPVVNESFLDIAALLNNKCAAQLLKSKSSFTIELDKGHQSGVGDFSYYQHLAADENNLLFLQPSMFARNAIFDVACL